MSRTEDLLRRILRDVVVIDERYGVVTDSEGYRTTPITEDEATYLRTVRDREDES